MKPDSIIVGIRTHHRDPFRDSCCSLPLRRVSPWLRECQTCGALWNNLDPSDPMWFQIVYSCRAAGCQDARTPRCKSCHRVERRRYPSRA